MLTFSSLYLQSLCLLTWELVTRTQSTHTRRAFRVRSIHTFFELCRIIFSISFLSPTVRNRRDDRQCNDHVYAIRIRFDEHSDRVVVVQRFERSFCARILEKPARLLHHRTLFFLISKIYSHRRLCVDKSRPQ